MDINLKGTYFGTQAATKRMIEFGGGSIISVLSVNSIFGDGNYLPYSTSKGAVRTLSYSLTYGPSDDGVRVNAIRPGAIRTKIGLKGAKETGEEQTV